MKRDSMVAFGFLFFFSILFMAAGAVQGSKYPYSFEAGFVYFTGAVLFLITLFFLLLVLHKEEVNKE